MGKDEKIMQTCSCGKKADAVMIINSQEYFLCEDCAALYIHAGAVLRGEIAPVVIEIQE